MMMMMMMIDELDAGVSCTRGLVFNEQMLTMTRMAFDEHRDRGTLRLVSRPVASLILLL